MSTAILDRFIEPFVECLTPDAAQKVASIRADDEIQQRIDELAKKANLGVLSPKEQSDYDGYLAAFHFITVLQARARRLLKS